MAANQPTSCHHARHDLLFRNLLGRGVFSVDDAGHVWRHMRFRGGKFWPLPAPRRADLPVGGGYRRVSIHLGRVRPTCGAHRVVWMAAGRPTRAELEINHKNGSRDDNRLENLELVTAGDNQRHCFRVLGRTRAAGELNGQHKLTEADVREMRRRRAQGESLSSLARAFGVAQGAVCFIVGRHRWKHV